MSIGDRKWETTKKEATFKDSRKVKDIKYNSSKSIFDASGKEKETLVEKHKKGTGKFRGKFPFNVLIVVE